MSDAKVNLPLRGTVARLVELFGDELPVVDLFGPRGRALSHNVSRNDRSEVPEFLRVGGEPPRQVLELACGNGRTTLPLLEAGYEVVGLDSSPDVLGRLAARLEEPQRRQGPLQVQRLRQSKLRDPKFGSATYPDLPRSARHNT